MIPVVVDTSVFVRYLIRPSYAVTDLIEAYWINDEIELITSPELIDELKDVLSRPSMRRFIKPQEGQALLDAIAIKATHLPATGPSPPFTRDPKDDKFVACALAGRARYLISYDKDILVLGSIADVRMVTPQQFVSDYTSRLD